MPTRTTSRATPRFSRGTPPQRSGAQRAIEGIAPTDPGNRPDIAGPG